MKKLKQWWCGIKTGHAGILWTNGTGFDCKNCDKEVFL